MRIPRVYAGDDGRSMLDEIDLELAPDEPGRTEGRRFEWSDPSRPIPFSSPWVATQLNFWTFPADYPWGPHRPSVHRYPRSP